MLSDHFFVIKCVQLHWKPFNPFSCPDDMKFHIIVIKCERSVIVVAGTCISLLINIGNGDPHIFILVQKGGYVLILVTSGNEYPHLKVVVHNRSPSLNVTSGGTHI